MPIKVCHVTSVHNPSDGRIFERECTSLTKCYDVTLIAPNVEDYEKNGVHVKGVPLPQNRLKRQRKLGRVLKKMIDINAEIYHFHDPELIPIGLKIKKRGKKVIFDSHEDVPSQILSKTYIPTTFLRKLVSKYYAKYENKSLSKYDGLVSVTPEIVNRLKKINPNTAMLTNYPIFNECEPTRTWEKRIGFAGAVSPNWNLHRVIDAIEDLDVTFELAGPAGEEYLQTLQMKSGWKRVNYHGIIKHQEVLAMLSKCSAGLALESYDNPNAGGRKGSIGVTKMYEYMQVGIPVIATDLDNWVPVVEGTESGYNIDSRDFQQIKETIEHLLNNKEEAKRLGDNGRKAIKEKYCWQIQEKTLIELYANLLKIK